MFSLFNNVWLIQNIKNPTQGIFCPRGWCWWWCWWWSWFRNCIYLSQKLIETITGWSTKTSSHRCHRIQLRVWQYKFCKVILDGAPQKRWKHIRSKVAPGWRHCHHFTAAQSWVAHNTESPLCALYVLHLCIQLLYICLIRYSPQSSDLSH